MRSSREPRSGIALILCLLVLVVLVAVVSQLSYSTSIEHKMAMNSAVDLNNEVALRSAKPIVLARLDITAKINSDGGSSEGSSGGEASEEDEGGSNSDESEADSKAYHTVDDPWARDIEETLGDAKLKIQVMDEERKFSLWWLVEGKEDDEKARDESRAQLAILLGIVLPQESGIVPDNLARDIQEWMIKKAGQWLETKRKPLEDSGIPILAIEELLFVNGVTDEVLYGKTVNEEKIPGLVEFLTLHSNGKVNLNTAGVEVIQSLLPDGVENPEQLAKAIVEARGGSTEAGSSSSGSSEYFKSLDDVQKVEGMDAEVSSDEEEDESATPAEDEEGGSEEEGGSDEDSEKSDKEGGNTVFDKIKPKIAVSSENFGVHATATSFDLTKEAYFVIERGKKESRIVYWKSASR